jgi:hypothetical protein
MADVVGGGLVAPRLGRIADRRPDQFIQTNQVADYRKALLSFRHGIAIDHPNLLSTKNTTKVGGLVRPTQTGLDGLAKIGEAIGAYRKRAVLPDTDRDLVSVLQCTIRMGI